MFGYLFYIPTGQSKDKMDIQATPYSGAILIPIYQISTFKLQFHEASINVQVTFS